MYRILLAGLILGTAACSSENDEAFDEAEAAAMDAEHQAMIEEIYADEGGEAAPAVQQNAMQASQKPAVGPSSKNKRSAANISAGDLPPGAVRVKRVEIIDHNGFEKPMVATTLLIPAEWNGKGSIIWNAQNPCAPGNNVQFEATSPDGRSSINIVPSAKWHWNSTGTNDQMGCTPVQITSTRQYIEKLVAQARPGAQFVDYRQRQDIEAQFQQYNSNSSMSGMHSQNWVEAGEALIAYTENGVEMRETVAAAVMFGLMRTDAMYGMAGSEFGYGVALPSFAMRAPNGQLDFKLAEMIRKSSRDNPEWSARMAKHNAKISQINAKGARDRAAITAKTNAEISQMQQDSWRRQNESSDRMQRESVEAIRGVETYNDPYNGGTVELDNTYDSAWQLNDGSYVLSNDPSFEPYKDLGVDATKLEVTQ
ncbi:MAG: hypothetical protein DHS20C05_16280 [Hyphococcus sp.]|nr:MAG: hypothetical protein DHS20C05_16280 [Marinicaulis sp.]